MNIPEGLNKAQLPEMLRTMILSREIELREERLKRQGRGWFQIGGRGHEGLLGATVAMRKGVDWLYGHYRDRIFCLWWGMTVGEMFLSYFAKADEPNSRARQMPSHYSMKEARLVSIASPVGSQFLPAVGCGMAARRRESQDVAVATSGDGTTSEGEFFEAVRMAVIAKANTVFLVEDNGYAISTPTASHVAWKIPHSLATDENGAEWLLGAPVHRCDGTDVFAVYTTMKRALDTARGGAGPSVVIADCVRLSSHSSADPDYLYRSQEDRDADKARDPVKKFAALMVSNGLFQAEEVEAMHKQASDDARQAADEASEAAEPDPQTIMNHIYAPLPDGLPRPGEPEPYALERIPDKKRALDMSGALRLALEREMHKNPRIHVFGEDVEDPKGGVFGTTKSLTKTFPGRVVNSPLAEATIAGVAVGMSLAGLLPVFEIQFIDYFDPATQQWKAQATTMHWRSSGDWRCPMVLRSPYGGYLPGGSIWHSQSNEALFAHLPGGYVAIPSTPADAYGMLVWAMRCGSPVLFLEPKHLYHGPREEYCVAPDEDYVVALGSASIRREGSDATIVTWGNCVYESLAAAEILADQDGAEVEVIDLRSIVPMDEATVIASLAKTNRLMVVHEDTRSCGFGAEVVARLACRPDTFGLLDAPLGRVSRPDVLVPYSPTLERLVMPHARCDQPFPGGQPHDPEIPHDTNIVTEMRKLLEY